MRGLDYVHGEMCGAVAGLLQSYTKGVLAIQHDYRAQRAVIEGMPDVTLQARAKLRQAAKSWRDRELEKLRARTQTALSDVRLYVATTGDAMLCDVKLSERDYSRDELKRARQAIDAMRGG